MLYVPKRIRELSGEIYWKNIPLMQIHYACQQIISYEIYEQSKVSLPLEFAIKGVNIETLAIFLNDRILPKTRQHLEWALADLGLEEYDEFEIFKKNHGLTTDDCY